MEENLTNTYRTKVSLFNLGEGAEPLLSIEVPEGLLVDLDLKANEILKWEINTETKEVILTKENIIINE